MDTRARRTDLFPRIEPYGRGMLDLDGRHRMYWEQAGDPDGVPVVFLHGGPGAGSVGAHRQFFDPSHYRIIVYDQRGAGRSEPYADVHDNTPRHLVADIEALRRHLSVDRWLVLGGSWGSLLALTYGLEHPDRCLGFILRGVFLGRPRELDWFLYGLRTVFPEAWKDFAEFIPAGERDDLLRAYHRRLVDPDPRVHAPAANAWCRYESRCSHLVPNWGEPSRSAEETASNLALARIEAHYFVNAMFTDGDRLLTRIRVLARHPAVVVQGRYDMICPIVTADDLARAWPEADYVIVADAGHSAMEPGIRSALVAATESLKDRHPLRPAVEVSAAIP